ncbi:carboxymuconolactone decarboxylase family protein [Marinifaba aquimaris]|uniref:carboxymuconolactone decarboxylase family protein n=1 Tax=Marinifaba aquimaris TaxID=2741323 RepID=UPI0031B5DB5B
MKKLNLHTIDSAPEAIQPKLQELKANLGMLPNLYGVLAAAPEALKAYLELHQHVLNSSFNAEEITVVWQTINVEHRCTYCVPAHTGIALSMKVDNAIIEALRNKQAMPNEKLEVLHQTTLAMVRSRGQLTDQQAEAFFAAGFSKQQLIEIVLVLSQKVISNYVNHLAETPLDKAFEKFAWS